MNVIDTITLAGSLILALPIGMLGVEFLVTGRPVAGVGFVAVAAALVLGQHYLEPDVKGRIAGGVVDLVVPDGDDGPDEPANEDRSSADARSEPVDIPSATRDARRSSGDDEEARRT